MEHQIEIRSSGIESEDVRIYSFLVDNDGLMEFEKFLLQYKNNSKYQRDLAIILARIRKLLEDAADDRHFRYEGKMNDRVRALPIESGKLRLYCLKINDNIVVIGNGGIKNVPRYQDDPHLDMCVKMLQKIDKKIRNGERREKIVTSGKDLEGELTFKVDV